MKISECMKRNVVSIPETSTIREAAAVFVRHHVGLLPVIDGQGRLIGVVGIQDLLTLELPDFIRFIEDLDFVHDFGAVETTRPPAGVLDRPITTLMKPPITVHEGSGLLRVYALLLQHHLHDMPVISDDGRLLGVASRVDIGTAILSAWSRVEQR